MTESLVSIECGQCGALLRMEAVLQPPAATADLGGTVVLHATACMCEPAVSGVYDEHSYQHRCRASRSRSIAMAIPADASEIDELLEVLSIERGCIQRSPARCGVEQLGVDTAPFIKMAVDAGMEQGQFHMINGMCGREAYWRCRLGSSIRETQSVYKACMTLFIKYRGVGQ